MIVNTFHITSAQWHWRERRGCCSLTFPFTRIIHEEQHIKLLRGRKLPLYGAGEDTFTTDPCQELRPQMKWQRLMRVHAWRCLWRHVCHRVKPWAKWVSHWAPLLFIIMCPITSFQTCFNCHRLKTFFLNACCFFLYNSSLLNTRFNTSPFSQYFVFPTFFKQNYESTK